MSKKFVKFPISYPGNKFKILEQLFNFFPNNINYLYEVFGGALTVGINTNIDNIYYNDINIYLKNLFEYLKKEEIEIVFDKINYLINKYNLKKGYKEGYYELRKDYNKNKEDIKLLLLLFYGFQGQIRFNNKHEFNNPIGLSELNQPKKEELKRFIQKLKSKNIIFYSLNFEEFIDEIVLKTNDNKNNEKLVYLDPPYLITLASYNDGKRGFTGWNEELEEKLLKKIDIINQNKIKFILSNVLEHKGHKNYILEKWYQKQGYSKIEIDCKKRKEIIIKNF